MPSEANFFHRVNFRIARLQTKKEPREIKDIVAKVLIATVYAEDGDGDHQCKPRAPTTLSGCKSHPS
jgi:hypothetical protein